jgi:hypothetical protein
MSRAQVAATPIARVPSQMELEVLRHSQMLVEEQARDDEAAERRAVEAVVRLGTVGSVTCAADPDELDFDALEAIEEDFAHADEKAWERACATAAVTGTRTIALSASTVAALALYGAVPTAAEVRAALTRALRRHALTDLAAQRVADRW